MKYVFFLRPFTAFLPLILVWSMGAFAMDEDKPEIRAAGSVTSENDFDILNEKSSPDQASDLEQEDSGLKALLEIDQVKKIRTECEQNPVTDKTLGECIWDKVEENPEIKAIVVEQLEEQNVGATSAANLNATNVRIEKDPAYIKLQEHLQKKLADSLYSGSQNLNADNAKKGFTDHANFYTLFKSQQGRNILTGISSFCLDAGTDSNGKFGIPEDDGDNIQKMRDFNLQKLQQDSSKQETIDTATAGSEAWNNCLVHLPHICQETKVPNPQNPNARISYENAGPKTDDEGLPDNIQVAGGATLTVDKQVTRTRACEIVGLIKAARQNIIAVEDIEKKLGDLETNNVSIQGIRGNELRGDDALSLTSKEVEDSGFSEANTDKAEKFKECFADGKLVDESQCEEFISKNKTDSDLIVAEEKLRLEAYKAKLEKDLVDEKGIVQYLKDEGRSEDEIAKILADNNGNVEKVKELITKKYEAEKEALFESLKKRAEAKTVSKDGELTAQDTDKLDAISKELTSKTKRFEELVFFNNIVSGYLEVGKEGARNRSSIARELENSAFTDPARAAASLGNTNGATTSAASSPIDIEKLQKKLEETGGASARKGQENTTLQVQEINELLIIDNENPASADSTR